MMIDAQSIKDYVEKTFPSFGVNKRQQVTRLLYEIAKREKIDADKIMDAVPADQRTFDRVKDHLVKRRYPSVSDADNKRHIFTELDVDPSLKAEILPGLGQIIPQHVLIEASVAETPLAQRIRVRFPGARFEIIPSYKEYTGREKFGLKGYNERLQKFFIVHEKYDFFKRCACSSKSVYCGYHVMNLGSGCAFDCAYCYLQDYINSPGIILPANIGDFFAAFRDYKQDIRFGSGELTDSLVFDHITGHSTEIVNFFRNYPRSQFEFKTKSNNIGNLLSIPGAENIIVAWTMSPEFIIRSTEFRTASLQQRIDAAAACARHGYKVVFHFDPMIRYPGWEKDYRDLLDRIYAVIEPSRIAWISIGTLRMTHKLKKAIENRFPDNPILDEEFIQGYDGKLRYPFEVRTEMYKKMKEWIEARDPEVYFYLCMEEKDACGACETAPLKPYRKMG